MSSSILNIISSENFSLKADLEQLRKVSEVNATEAMVFYSGRVLEATSNFCVEQLGEKSKSNVFANIEYINDFNLLDETTHQWAHALRRLANQFRHILKPTEENDGAISVILMDMWLEWLTTRSHLLNDTSEILHSTSTQQYAINEQFNCIGEWLVHKDISQIDESSTQELYQQPVFASVICEELINQKDFEHADNLLKTALESHPNDLRLKQLQGLYLSRTGKLNEAEILLRKLLKQFPSDDETIGILAGVVKKLWQDGNKDKLSQWGRLYIKGWQQSKQRNTYLGINAATYSLWSGDQNASQTIASEIIYTYAERKKILKQRLNVNTNQMDYWDHATLAESYFLAGMIEQAEESYHELFENHCYRSKPHEIPANQLAHHLSMSSTQPSSILDKLVDSHASIK